MNTLYKQDGTKVEVNDSSLEAALELGWSKTNPTKKAVKKPIKKAS